VGAGAGASASEAAPRIQSESANAGALPALPALSEGALTEGALSEGALDQPALRARFLRHLPPVLLRLQAGGAPASVQEVLQALEGALGLAPGALVTRRRALAKRALFEVWQQSS
jgi:hypothetical protein